MPAMHLLADHALLFLGGVHALEADDEFVATHGTVSSKFRDSFHHHRSIMETITPVAPSVRSPTLNGRPGAQLAIMCNNLIFVVNQHKSVVWILLEMLFMLLTVQRK